MLQEYHEYQSFTSSSYLILSISIALNASTDLASLFEILKGLFCVFNICNVVTQNYTFSIFHVAILDTHCAHNVRSRFKLVIFHGSHSRLFRSHHFYLGNGVARIMFYSSPHFIQIYVFSPQCQWSFSFLSLGHLSTSSDWATCTSESTSTSGL